MGVESPVNKRTEAAAVPTLRNHWCRHFRGLVLRNELENRGIRQDGDQRGGQSRFVNLRRNQPRMQRDLGDDERELSDLSQAHSHLEGSLPRVSEHTHNSCPDKKFSHHDQSNKQSEHSPARLVSQVRGSMSMPTVTKKRATKASRIGSVCFASL